MNASNNYYYYNSGNPENGGFGTVGGLSVKLKVR